MKRKKGTFFILKELMVHEQGQVNLATLFSQVKQEKELLEKSGGLWK